MITDELSEILLAIVFSVKRKLPQKMVIIYATRRAGTDSAATGKMTFEMCAPLELMVSRAMGASVRQPQSKVTSLSFCSSE